MSLMWGIFDNTVMPEGIGIITSLYSIIGMNAVLLWYREQCRGLGVNIVDFGTSFRDGLAFSAVLSKLPSNNLDFSRVNRADPVDTLQVRLFTASYIMLARIHDSSEVSRCTTSY